MRRTIVLNMYSHGVLLRIGNDTNAQWACEAPCNFNARVCTLHSPLDCALLCVYTCRLVRAMLSNLSQSDVTRWEETFEVDEIQKIAGIRWEQPQLTQQADAAMLNIAHCVMQFDNRVTFAAESHFDRSLAVQRPLMEWHTFALPGHAAILTCLAQAICNVQYEHVADKALTRTLRKVGLSESDASGWIRASTLCVARACTNDDPERKLVDLFR